jgi:hypothetical protein
MYHKDWFKLRYELIRDYPGCPFDKGSILEAFEFEGKIKLYNDSSILPNHFKDHFRLLRWWEHRTLEQLSSIKYAKVVSGSNYYVSGDVVEVLLIMYNNAAIVGGKNSILFNLNGHFFVASQIEPATKEDHEKWVVKNRT